MGGIKFTLEQIVSIVSAVGISSIIGIVFNLVQSNKRNHLDYITQERSKWRKQLKKVIDKLNSNDIKDRDYAVNKLKNQINPYGRNMDIKKTKLYFMKEGHIWDLLDNKENLEYDKLIFFVELLLKFDWERSKREVIIKPYKFINGLIRFTLLSMSIYNVYLIASSPIKSVLSSMNLCLSFMAILLLITQKMVTTAIILNPSKKLNVKFWIFVIFYAFPCMNVMWNFLKLINIQPAVLQLFTVVGMIIYELYFLSFFNSYEDDYVREIERYLASRNRNYRQGVYLANRLKDRESKLYQYEYDVISIKSMEKQLKKIKKKLTKKKRPQNFYIHPILFYKYKINRKRIIKETKKIL